MSPTKKHRPPNGDSCKVSFGTITMERGDLAFNRRRALIVRRHRAWLERELAKLEGEP